MLRGLLLAFALFACAASATGKTTRAERILVDKSERTLYVFADKKIVARFPIALGLQPVGHKEREGDNKTPEGRYILDWKKANSDYYRAIHVSYPNAADIAHARKLGVSPGGAIMIHGQPNDPKVRRAVRVYPFRDWTYGCIALSNEDMQALWDMVRVPTPIEIRA